MNGASSRVSLFSSMVLMAVNEELIVYLDKLQVSLLIHEA